MNEMVAYLIMRNKTWNRMVTSLIGAGKECNETVMEGK